jgi:hypothetical protein
MVTERLLEEKDLEILDASLKDDEYHKTTPISFFTEYGTLSKVYELDGDPVLVVRASKSLRIDVQYLSNTDYKRNKQVMLEGFPSLVQRAKENGFLEIIFDTDSPLLKRFCERELGFIAVEGNVLRKPL